MPRRLTVTAGTPTAALPVSQTRIASARSRSAFFGTKSSSPPVPCSSEPSTTSLRLTGTSVAQRTQRGQVHQDVALAVRGSAAEPAAVDLGQLEGRGPPGIVVQRRLHVVVRVEQHGRASGPGPGPAAHDGVAAVGGLVQADVGEPFLAERVEHPVGCARALLRRELPGVGHRLDRDQLGQLLADARHQRADVLLAGRRRSLVHRVGVLEVADVALEVLERVGAVDLDHGQLAEDGVACRRRSAASRARWSPCSASSRASPWPGSRRGSRRWRHRRCRAPARSGPSTARASRPRP